MESRHRFDVSRRPHNRIRTLRTEVHALCAVHGSHEGDGFLHV
jgi:hypothetical protein